MPLEGHGGLLGRAKRRLGHPRPSVEIEVQKRLDLMSNEAIEAFGMAEFNQACRESVWTYEAAWREMTERMAYWVDLDNPSSSPQRLR